MTPKLAMYIRIAHHHIDGTPLDEKDRIEQQRIRAIEEFQVYIARRIDFSIRLEVMSPANWSWEPSGTSVRFSVDGQSFLLAQQNGGCLFFLEAGENKIPLAVLSDEDKQFADYFLVEIGDALARTNLPCIKAG